MAIGVNQQSYDETCPTCAKGKQARQPFKSSKSRAKNILELVHIDLCGPMETPSFGGKRYMFTIVDDYSRYTHVHFLSHKNEAFDRFLEFKAQAERQTDHKIKIIRSDGGKEFVNKQFSTYLKKEGIRHQTSVRYSSSQNGVVERAQRSIVEKARCMLADASLPKSYWAEAVNTAVYLNNRSPTKAVHDKTPFEAWTGNKPDLSHIRIFGCKAMAQVPRQKRKKWDPKSEEYIFVGYGEDTKGYRLLHPVTKQIQFSRDVIFLEEDDKKIISSAVKKSTEKSCVQSSEQVIVKFPDQTSKQDNQNSDEDSEDSVDRYFEDFESEEEETAPRRESTESTETETEDFKGFCSAPSVEESTSEEEQNPSQDVRRSDRLKGRSAKTDVIYFAENFEEDPTSVQEALSSPQAEQWKRAMDEEALSLIKNDTYEWVTLPKGKKSLMARWVLKTKIAESQQPKFKARLVVKGCAQRPGLDYTETFSPVVKYTSLRYLFALAAKEDLDITHMDVTTAYLHGPLEEEIYVSPPAEIRPPANKPGHWKLKKAIYGLKQSGRCWNRRLNDVLTSCGLKPSKADPCVFILRNERETGIIATWVDDLLIFTNNSDLKMKIKRKLESNFSMKDLGDVKTCLGMKITRNRSEGKLWISQEDCAQKNSP
ncbi:unnamed protein product [Nesidiocoris tenuis]|uniref:Integrase catalytic domain-containing protein n=1 Tax=Nesidiocoris tenuis TaxID=355587 RepID=A0A6H5GEM5_9HEMI|nr:unnamed protein product [Nesidiocoris tenuis]